MPMEVTIVDDPAQSTMSAAEMDWRTSLHLEIVNQLRIKDGQSFTAEIEFTDFFANFSGDSFRLYVSRCEHGWVVMLPTEY